MIEPIYLALFPTLIGFLLLLFFGSYLNRTAVGIIACATILISFLSFGFLTWNLDQHTFHLFDWISYKNLQVPFSLYFDHLSGLMGLIITGVGFLIHVYSIGYMEEEKDYSRYFACLNFFVFAMLLLVLAKNLLLLFVGWEGVGLASYLLIGFWYSRPEAAKAATKAFIVNRIGDTGLLVGILLTYYLFGTSDIQEISEKAGAQFGMSASILTILTLLYFIGATGKSAQVPLHTWLPDAMEGPTPVSALIHAATMVTAGVYLVVRLHSLYLLTPSTLHWVGIIGGITSLFAALCAIGQTDLKRVLAYSTVSQLGLMFLACGVGAFYAAMFHLTTHAFAKALLFLSAGNVIHMMHGKTELSEMGGLSKSLPKTNWLFLLGVLAMSGVPPLSAFFSKDLILEQDYLAGFETFFFLGLTTSLLTAFYLMRAYLLAFHGESRENSIKEAPNVMLIPCLILGVLSAAGGFLGFCLFCTKPILQMFLEKADVELAVEEKLNWEFLFHPETIISVLVALIGIFAAIFLYLKSSWRRNPPLRALKSGFYVDHLYKKTIVIPIQTFSRWLANFFEPEVINGSIIAFTTVTDKIAKKLQTFQSGQIRSYLAWFIIGIIFLLLYVVVRSMHG